MTQSDQKKQSKKLSIMLWIVFSLLIISIVSCDVSKKSIKNKTTSTLDAELKTQSNSQSFDFSTTDKDEYSLNYQPFDHSKVMWVVTKNGDTIASQNAIVTNAKSNTQTRNNKVSHSETNSNNIEKQTIDSIDKKNEKTEKFSSEIILYFMLAIVIIAMFTVYLIYKTINKNTAAMQAVLQKL